MQTPTVWPQKRLLVQSAVHSHRTAQDTAAQGGWRWKCPICALPLAANRPACTQLHGPATRGSAPRLVSARALSCSALVCSDWGVPFATCLFGQRGVMLRMERAVRSSQPVLVSLLPAFLAPAFPSQGRWHTSGSKLLGRSDTVAHTSCGTQVGAGVPVQSSRGGRVPARSPARDRRIPHHLAWSRLPTPRTAAALAPAPAPTAWASQCRPQTERLKTHWQRREIRTFCVRTGRQQVNVQGDPSRLEAHIFLKMCTDYLFLSELCSWNWKLPIVSAKCLSHKHHKAKHAKFSWGFHKHSL